MKVALLNTKKETMDAFIQTFGKVQDSVSFSSFTTVEDYMNRVRAQRLVFDRLIVWLGVFKSKESIKALRDFVRSINATMPVVFVCSAKSPLATRMDVVMQVFTSQIHIDMMLERSTSKDIVAAVTWDVDRLVAEYSKRGVRGAEVLGAVADEATGGTGSGGIQTLGGSGGSGEVAGSVEEQRVSTESVDNDVPVLGVSGIMYPSGIRGKRKARKMENDFHRTEEAFIILDSGGRPV